MKNKKILSVLVSALCAVSACSISVPFSASAVEGTYGSLTYYAGVSEAVITDCSPDATYEVIPSTLDGVPVTKIDEQAFKDCTKLKGVVIPDTVKNVGANAFENCSTLIEVTIPDTVTSISGYMFAGCTALTKLELPKTTISIGFDAFKDCTKLKDIVLPEAVQTIGASAFENCTSLTKLDIPNAVVSIGDSAFEKCTSLESSKIGSSVKILGGYAYSNCHSLKSIVIPKSVTSIGGGIFRNSFALTSLKVEPGNKAYCAVDNVLLNADKTEIIAYPSGIKSYGYTIPETVTKINDYAFYGTVYLHEIRTHKNLTCIGDYAFYSDNGKSGITAIYNDEDYMSNGSYTENVAQLLQNIFDSIKTTENNWYQIYRIDGKQVLFETDLCDSWCTIWKNYSTYDNKYSLRIVKMGKLEEGYNHDNCVYGGYIRFNLLDFTHRYVDENGKEFMYTVSECERGKGAGYIIVKEYYTPPTEPSYDSSSSPNYYLSGNVGSTKVEYYPNKKEYVISPYENILEAQLKSSDYGIGKHFPISQTISAQEFDKVLKVPDIDENFKNDIFGKNKYLYSEQLDTTANETDTLEFESYKYHKYDSNVGICGYDENATSAEIPGKIDRLAVTAIEDNAFYRCTGLQSAKISDYVETIGNYAFYFNSKLRSVTIPYSVSSIGDYAFAGCTDIKDVYYNGSKEEWAAITIGTNNECLTKANIHFNSTGPDNKEYILDKTTAELNAGDTLALSVADYADSIDWASDDVSIATVSDNGEVKALKAGNTVIYAMLSNGTVLSCAVVVKETAAVTTSAPESTEPTESTGSDSTETTAAPVETTSAPDETTSAPAVTTSAPDETTAAPVVTTSAPDETTAAPVVTTSAPTETTAAPVETTSEPDETTAAPVVTTSAPDETTAAPVVTTSAPDETTAAPVETTSAPTETTAAPAVTTSAPDETTAAPVVTTPASGETTVSTGGTTTVPASSEATTAGTTTTSPTDTTTAKVGDIDGDGEITLKDAVLIRRFIAGGWKVDITNKKAADIDGDGEITLKDAVLIRRFIAGGWNVTI